MKSKVILSDLLRKVMFTLFLKFSISIPDDVIVTVHGDLEDFVAVNVDDLRLRVVEGESLRRSRVHFDGPFSLLVKNEKKFIL